VANLGYAVVAQVGVNRPVMYTAQALEYTTSGLAAGAFGVLLLRLTQKRFSATQYALLSSLFTLPRILAGPVAGVLADTIGWRNFFLSTPLFGIPGLIMLARFLPWGVRDVEIEVEAEVRREPLSRTALVVRSVLGGVAGLAVGLSAVALVGGLAGVRAHRGFTPVPALRSLVQPVRIGDWTGIVGVLVLAGLVGLATAATLVARRGTAGSLERTE